MMKNKRAIIFILIFIAVVFVFLYSKKGVNVSEKTLLISPVMDNISITVTTTGVVEPQNRLEIKPSIAGRIEKIMVREGDHVKEGDILVWMSSTERAALIDAARAQGEEALKYWEEAYKKSPIISPLDGEVIVRAVEPGQTVTTQDAILVLSDRLVVSAQFDETDIGRVRKGQKAEINLDAYPEIEITGTVDHVAYESKIVNNVTIYDVDILPDRSPEIMRSGMSVTVDVVEEIKSNVLTIPSAAINYEENRTFVIVKEKNGKIEERNIKIGVNNDKNAEVISGLSAGDKLLIKDLGYLPKKKSAGTNPFMPTRRR